MNIHGEHVAVRVTIPVCHTHAGNATPQQVARESSAAHAGPSVDGKRVNRFGRSLSSRVSATSRMARATTSAAAIKAVGYCTGPFGQKRTARSRTDGTFTTSTAAKTTIGSKTSSLFRRNTTAQSMPSVLHARRSGGHVYRHHSANAALLRYPSITRASNAARSSDQPARESGFAHLRVTPNSGPGSAATRVDSSVGGS